MGEISKIIDVGGFNEDLTTVINGISKLEGKIDEASGKTLTVIVDMKGADNLNALIDATNKYKQAAEDLKAVQGDANKLAAQTTQAVQLHGEAAVKTAISIGNASGEVKALTKHLKDLQTQQANTKPDTWGYDRLGKEISTVTQKIALLAPRIKQASGETNNFQINIGKANVSLEAFASQIGRSLLRFAAYTIVIGGTVKVIELLTTSIMENIKGTDQWLEKQNKIIDANKMLIQSFSDLTDEMLSARDAQNTVFESMDKSVDGAKRLEAAQKALGVVNGAVYEAEKKQGEARNNTLVEELKLLKQKDEVLTKNVSLLLNGQKEGQHFIGSPEVINSSANHDPSKNKNVQFELFSKLSGAIKKTDLPEEKQDAVILKLNKAYDEGGDILAVYAKSLREVAVQLKKNSQAMATNQAEQDNINTALEAKRKALSYQTALDLNKQIAQVHEQFRLAKEKEDIASVDKIIKDTQAKYSLMAMDISRSREAYRLSMTTEDDVKYTDDNIRAYDDLLSVLTKIGDQESINSQFELNKSRHFAQENAGANEAQGVANIAQSNSDNGAPSYEAMVKAQNLQTAAKVEHAKLEFQQLSDQYRLGNMSTAEIEKQFQEKLITIDTEAYKERLALANDYFNKISQHLSLVAAINKTNIETSTLSKETAILRGGGSQYHKERMIRRAENQGNRRKAIEDIENAENSRPGAIDAVQSNKKEFQSATNASKAAPGDKALADKAAISKGQLDISKKNLADIEKAEEEAKNTIARIDNDEAQERKDKLKEIADYTIQVAQETVSAITTIKNNQFQHEQDLLDLQSRNVQLNAQQKMQSINASTGYAIQKQNQLALVNAQATAAENILEMKKRQLNIEKARYERSAAEASILVNTAAGIVKALVDPGWPECIPIMVATAAIGAVQFAAASSAPIPTYEFGTENHPGGYAIIGEAKEREYVQTPSGESFWSKPEATLIDLPAGSSVTPEHKYIENAAKNIGSEDSYNYQVEANRAIQYQTQIIAGQISKDIKEQTEEIVYAVLASRTPPQNYDRQIELQLNRYKYNR